MSLAGLVKGWFSSAKNAGTSWVVEQALRSRLAAYGKMIDFKLDSNEKTAELELLLKGEDTKIRFFIEKYELINENGVDYVVVRKASASREWMNTLLQSYLIDKKFPLPEKHGKAIKLAL